MFYLEKTFTQVSEKLMVMREECLEGKFDSIKKLRETNVPNVSYTRQVRLPLIFYIFVSIGKVIVLAISVLFILRVSVESVHNVQ